MRSADPRFAQKPSRVADVLLSASFGRAPVFTTRDIVAATNISPSAVVRALGVLGKRKSIVQVTRGVWARPDHPDFSPYAVVPFLLGASIGTNGWQDAEPGYVSLLSALSLHGLIDQIPRTIQIIVGGQRPPVRSEVGVYTFHRMQPSLLTGYEPGGRLANFELATPTKALFDTLYISTRRGRQHAFLPELDLSRFVRDAEIRRYIALIPSVSVQTAVLNRWRHLRQRGTRRS
jgi:predicted transcriptional regulator of viral defense system